MINWHIGCSGFHYKHWKGSFYPEQLSQKNWFDYYCRHFNSIELNVTFYRFPRVPVLQNLYRQSPESFRFAVKAPRAITHFKKFVAITDMLADFYRLSREGLGEKLGCVLFQMPEQFVYSEERLERILKNLDNSFSNVMEFRHPSWWTGEVFKELGSGNISFCGMSHPALPTDVVNNSPLLYYRLHGEGQLYGSDYSDEQISELTKTILKEAPADAYVFFNNDIHSYAPFNASAMRSKTS